jgi:hypothetical protein
VVLEITAPESPLDFGCIEVNVIDPFDSFLGGHVRDTGESLVPNLGQKALVAYLHRPANAIGVLEIVFPNG